MIKSKKSASKKAATSKKASFFNCDGCFGRFPVGLGIMAPPNKYKFKKVCKSCFKQYISKTVPVPAVSSQDLKDKYGSFMTYGGKSVEVNKAGILSNANAGILSNANAGLISDKSGGFMGKNTGTLIGTDGATLIGTDGAT